MTGKSPASVDDLPPPREETWRQRLTYWQYRAVWEVAARLPDPVAARTPAALGDLWHRFGSDRQQSRVRANLARILGPVTSGELDAVVAAAHESYARYWLDAFRLHTLDPDEVVANSTSHGLERVDDLLADGEGAILATAHLGSWDVGALFTNQRDWDVAVVAEVLEPRRLFDQFVDLRRRAGIEVYPLVRGGDMVDRMVDVVDRGGLATLLADRDLGRKGPIVEFFGEPCRLPAGTAVVARRTGRPVAVGAFFAGQPDRWHAHIHSVVDIAHLSVPAGTQVVARELEGLISRAPEQWHMFVPNWLVDREPDHAVARAWATTGQWPAGWDAEAQAVT